MKAQSFFRFLNKLVYLGVNYRKAVGRKREDTGAALGCGGFCTILKEACPW